MLLDCIIKVGGAFLTDKSRFETLNDAHLEAFASALSEVDHRRFILIHGAGSFGHAHAHQYAIPAYEVPCTHKSDKVPNVSHNSDRVPHVSHNSVSGWDLHSVAHLFRDCI
jgi:isopentenyl phosphate kinase